jgi:cardiolipin synthase A/B
MGCFGPSTWSSVRIMEGMMGKRLFWLLLASIAPLCFVLVLGKWGGQTAVAAPTNSPSIVINEIHADPADGLAGDANGDGSRSSTDDEFVELVNVGSGQLDLSGWILSDTVSAVNQRHVFPPGTILWPDCAVVVFGGGNPTGSFGQSIVQTASTGQLGLNNGGDTILLADSTGTIVVSYTYGSEGGDDQSITRHPDLTGSPLIRHTQAAGDPNALFSPGVRVDGTQFCIPPLLADLAVAKTGPAVADPGATITYTLRLQNLGQLTATEILLTDTLPAGLSYTGHSGGYPLAQPDPQTLVWQMGDLPPTGDVSFYLTATIDTAVPAALHNALHATTPTTETTSANNQVTAVTLINHRTVLIDAIHYEGYESSLDEAVALRNVGATPVDVGGWQLSDGVATAVIPANVLIPPHAAIWLTNDADAFYRQFGHAPDLARTPGAFAIPALAGAWPGFANAGDEVLLRNTAGMLVDVLVYEAGNTAQAGWSGTAVQPFIGSGLTAQGQILYRLRDPLTGQPVPDTNTAADWAQSTTDPINGRKVRYPGWDLDEFFFPARLTETAVLTIAIAPDNAYEALIRQIEQAQHTIQIESLTIESVAIGQALAQAATRGVTVTLLLEGGPPGGLTDQEKYVCWQIHLAGGQCWFMINDPAAKIYDRYSFLHAKFMLIDDAWAVISTQNLSPDSLPNDDKHDGTWGRRGVVLITDAPGVVQHLATVLARDLDTAHRDLFRWTAEDDRYGRPSPGFVPITASGGITYPVRFPQPLGLAGDMAWEIIQSPENSLRDVDGLLGLVNRAAMGDVVLVQQLYERPFWGPTATGTPLSDPNPRLQAYIAAARRGAHVRLLLDAYFDDGRSATSNRATCDYVNALAADERLKLNCALNNPTGLGIHSKMVLVQINGQGYVHVGSLNGSEQSHKDNRELALQVQSNPAYALLADMFWRDWPHRLYLPLVLNNYIGPAGHILISEVLYDPPGPDVTEFIELVNPTSQPWDLSGYSIGDAVNRSDFEDVRRFPPGTTLASGQTLVITLSALDFFAEYGFYPDFEILETVTAVPNLIDDPTWGDPATFLQLGNEGDEVILRGPDDEVIDVMAYGSGSYPGVTSCPLVTLLNASLERFPYWRDTNDCLQDFRQWPFPSPGLLP